MAVFKAFKPEAMNKIAKAMGYSGDMGQFQSYIEQDPMRQQQMQRYTNAAMQMARGGDVKKMFVGGNVARSVGPVQPIGFGTVDASGQMSGGPAGGVSLEGFVPMRGGAETAQAANTPAAQTQQTGITEATMQRMFTPGLPQGGQVTAATTPLAAGQMIDPRVGAVAGGVAALWVCAIGLWWIKYYVECNQKLRTDCT